MASPTSLLSILSPLPNRNVVKAGATEVSDNDVYIGRSEVAMWIRVISSWLCMLLYIWSLIAPVLLPDRYANYSYRPPPPPNL
jgi:hypothetical protein